MRELGGKAQRGSWRPASLPEHTLPSQVATRALPACRSWFPELQVLSRKPGLWVYIPKDRQQKVDKLDSYKQGAYLSSPIHSLPGAGFSGAAMASGGSPECDYAF